MESPQGLFAQPVIQSTFSQDAKTQMEINSMGKYNDSGCGYYVDLAGTRVGFGYADSFTDRTVSVFFYSNENGEPQHVHVESDEKVAKYWLEPYNWHRAMAFGLMS